MRLYWGKKCYDRYYGYGPIYNDTKAIICLVLFILSVIMLIYLSKCEIVVTDKRVYGRASFGRRVDLPFDLISAVSTSSLLKGVTVSTSSGKIAFVGLSNAFEIYKSISNLLIERQIKQETNNTNTIKHEIPQNNADELKKYKELLDSGVITQEEFDAKKKQLLGL